MKLLKYIPGLISILSLATLFLMADGSYEPKHAPEMIFLLIMSTIFSAMSQAFLIVDIEI